MTAAMISRIGAEACGAVLRHVTVRSENAGARLWNSRMRDAVYLDTKPESMKAWLARHHRSRIATLQCRVDPMSQDVRNVWEPPIRTAVTAATYADFYEDEHSYSRRYYSGIRAVRSSESTWIGYDYSMNTLIVYRVVEG